MVSRVVLFHVSAHAIHLPYPQGIVLCFTYSAYCITPFEPSWLGNGTSCLGLRPFMGGGVPGLPLTSPNLDCCCSAGAASFLVLEEIEAVATRKGWRAVVGLARWVVSRLWIP